MNEIKQLLDSGAQQGADFVHLAMGPMQGSENEQYVSRSPSCEGAVEVSGDIRGLRRWSEFEGVRVCFCVGAGFHIV